MFDFNDVKKEINTNDNGVFNEISLDLLDINPCKLFYSLYDIPVIGERVSEIKNCYYLDNVWYTNQYSYRDREDCTIPNKLMQYILNNPENNYSTIYLGTERKVSHIVRNSNIYNEFLNYLKINRDFYFLYDWTRITIHKNKYFTIFELNDGFPQYAYFILLNIDEITENNRTYNKVLNSYNNVKASDYNKVTEKLHTILNYKSYARYIVFDLYNNENMKVNVNNKLLLDGNVRFFNDIYNNKAYFIYNMYSIYDVCRLNTAKFVDFFKLLLLPDDTMLNIVNNLRNSDYTCTAEINGNKLNIHITDNLVDVPEYIKLFYTYGYKIKNNNEKLRAAVIDL